MDESRGSESPTKKLKANAVGCNGRYPPMLCGMVSAVGMRETDDEPEEDFDWSDNDAGFDGDVEEGEPDECVEQPPQLTDEEKENLDIEAAKEEVLKLRRLGVVQEVTKDQCDPSGKFITLKEVYDWRFRKGSSDTFAPTSASCVTKMMMVMHMMRRWKAAVIDVKDAFLCVDQQELVYVWVRPWMRKVLGLGDDAVWLVRKCLPGQRNAGLRWYEKITGVLREMGFESCISMPSVMRHTTRPLVVNIHVDDELALGEDPDLRWLIRQLQKMFQLQVEGPVPEEDVGCGEEISYLKKRFIFVRSGILVKPNKKYVEKLTELMGTKHRKGKSIPEHGDLGKPDKTGELDIKQQKQYRSGVGICMYVAQERIDVQHAVKQLTKSMRRPTKQALVCLRRLALYLQDTADFGMLMEFASSGFRMICRLNGGQQQHGADVVECFCDSDWGGNMDNRKSTTSVVVCVNSIVVYSYCRGQKSAALSSCEAEILAMTSGASESFLIRDIWMFISYNKEALLELRSDSSSGRQWLQRSGVGRLKRFQIRLCWLQQAIKERELCALPVGTKLNIADLNAKRLTASRRKFLMYFMGVVRADNSDTFEHVGQSEFHDHLLDKMAGHAQQTGFNTEKLLKVLLVTLIKGSAGQVCSEPGKDQETEWRWLTIFICGVCMCGIPILVWYLWKKLQKLGDQQHQQEDGEIVRMEIIDDKRSIKRMERLQKCLATAYLSCMTQQRSACVSSREPNLRSSVCPQLQLTFSCRRSSE